MANLTTDELRDRILDLKFEPSRVMDLTLGLLEESLEQQEGKVLDPSQPLPFLVENDVALTHAAIEAYEITTMRQYPIMAQSESDLFLHMSDADMVGMYAVPGDIEFFMILSKAEVQLRAVQVDDSRTYKLTIPKHTSVEVNGFTFTMQYPINILIRSHGGIDISWDLSHLSPLQTLKGNRIEWDVVRMNSRDINNPVNEYLRLFVPMKQMKLTTYSETTNATSIFKKSFGFTDQFVYARAFRRTAGNKWEEIITTHSDHTYDPTKLTLQLKVIGQTLKIELPYIYQSSVSGTLTIRVDIYTTKGEQYVDFSGLTGNSLVTKFEDLDNTDNNLYTAPLSKLDSFAVMTTGALSGGRDVLSFEERRERVLRNNTGQVVQPISHNQLEGTLNDLGFDVSLNTDDVISRTYRLSRTMPAHRNGLSTSPIDCAVMTAKASVDMLSRLETVKDNISQITLTPDTLYKDVAGSLIIVPDEERNALGGLRGDFLANELLNNNYLYTPLHYVLDLKDERIDVRPYFLTRPRLDISGFYAISETIDLEVMSSSTFFIEYTETGYKLSLITESNDPFKEIANEDVFVQLAFKPDVENEWVYINGTIVRTTEDKERVIEFDLETDWIIQENHQLSLTNFTLRVNEHQIHDTPLKGDFYLVWSVRDYYNDGLQASEVDELLGTHLLPDGCVGIYAEKVNIHLGDELTGLWRRSRPVIGTMSFETHEYNLPMTYASNVYEYDNDGKIVVMTDNDGKKRLKTLHKKGDPVLDEVSGEPVYVFRKGDVKLDEYGEPIPSNGREVMYWWDMVLFDAKYRYATRPLDVEYERTFAYSLVEWVNETLGELKEMALERTQFSFQPRNTLKYIPVLADDGELVSIYSAQHFVIDLYLDSVAFRDSELRVMMIDSVNRVIQTHLERTVFSKEKVIRDILVSLGDGVVTASMTGLGGGDYKVVTLMDKTTRLCLAKVLSVESDGSLSIKDDIVINFKRHAS